MPEFINKKLQKQKIQTIQINIGNICNQSCAHCHVNAGRNGENIMDSDTALKIVEKLKTMDVKTVEFTGGTPEMAPCFQMMLEMLADEKDIYVRTSATVLLEDEFSHYKNLYKKLGVRLICSLPSLFEKSTDRQRGKGTHSKLLQALKMLNEEGFSDKYELDLVYNPTGDYLPSSQCDLERDYKKILSEQYGIKFNKLFALVNVPVSRYAESLKKEGRYDDYMNLLKENFNPGTIGELMCRTLLSVGWDGRIYDCDFNQACGEPVKGYEDKKFWEIDFDSFNPEISLGEHCYACTSGSGSSCSGELVEAVKQYYGDELTCSEDLKTGACCTAEEVPKHVRDSLAYINDEIVAKYYGCGSPVPACIEGITALDLGCGTGRDSYVLSRLAGENGFVYGLDMTPNQIEIAQKYIEEQTEIFGYKKPNVKFIHDYIQNISEHFEEESIDLITSNCVINLVSDKQKVLNDAYSILREGGEVYFSDIYSDRRLPENLKNHPVLYGECLGGALYHRDFESFAKKAGFTDPRIVSSSEVELYDEEIKGLVGNIRFYSVTYRLFKLKGLDDGCEDYGHAAAYIGGADEFPINFKLDKKHIFEKGRYQKICGNTEKMLSGTRFAPYFDIIGSYETHFGEFTDKGGAEENEEDGKKDSCC